MLWKGPQVPRGLGHIRKKTKKKPWKGQSRSRRFSFHKYFTTFFYLFLFNHFTLSFFSIPFLPTTFTHYPLPTTFDPRHLATLKQYLSLNRYFVFHLAGQLRTWISNDKCRYSIQGSHQEINTNKGKTLKKIPYRTAHIYYIIHRAIQLMSFEKQQRRQKRQ